MKKIIILSLLTFCSFYTNAQIITFDDAALEAALLNAYPGNSNAPVDADADGSITVAEAQAITMLNVSGKNIFSLVGLEQFTNLERFFCDNNHVTDIDLLQNLNRLTHVSFINNNLLNVDVIEHLPELIYLECQGNYDISSIDVSQLHFLEYLDCSSIDFLSEINITNNPYLNYLNVNNTPITHLFIKNGNEQLLTGANLNFEFTSNLNYICVDDFGVTAVAQKWANYNGTSPDVYLDRINSYCSFVPGGINYEISGQNSYDANANGCDVSDASLPFLRFSIDDGTNSGSIISNASGAYSIAVPQGTYTVTPELNPYFTVSPSNLIVSFPSASTPTVQDFCITANGTFNDLEVAILPLEIARPGFDVVYSIQYKNKGTTILSGDINLLFDDNYLDYVSATPAVSSVTTGELRWTYSNLQPFETREVLFTMNANTPTDPSFPLNSGDILSYTAQINSAIGDETPEDNTFVLNQEVVNSYDPNDKRCLEGKTILPTEVGDYVTYLIRFENNGTASAVNIVVKDEIDTSTYDMSSFEVLNGSHDFVTKIRDTNVVEFIFENINLPFDDATNDGYVSFKIKTLPTLVENDTFENKAEIYFDYNPAIITNLEQTKVESALSIETHEFINAIQLYPNPANDYLTVFSKDTSIQKIEVYTYLGKKIMTSVNTESINIKNIESGLYILKVHGEHGEISVKKFVKN